MSEPPAVWAAFSLHHAELVSPATSVTGDFCYQAISLIDTFLPWVGVLRQSTVDTSSCKGVVVPPFFKEPLSASRARKA